MKCHDISISLLAYDMNPNVGLVGLGLGLGLGLVGLGLGLASQASRVSTSNVYTHGMWMPDARCKGCVRILTGSSGIAVYAHAHYKFGKNSPE